MEKHKVNLTVEGRETTLKIVTSGQPDTVIYLGFGNEGRAAEHSVKLLQEQGITDVAVVGPLPYWWAAATQTALQDIGTVGTIAAADYIRKRFKVKTLHAIGESQAGGALVYGALARPDVLTGRVALLKPMGLVSLGRREFARRHMQDIRLSRHSLDWRVWPIAGHVTKRVLQDWAQKGDRLAIGLSWEIGASLRQLHQQKSGSVRIFAAQNDKLYPPAAMRATLKKFDLEDLLIVIAGNHSSPATRAGSRQVKAGIEWCRSN